LSVFCILSQYIFSNNIPYSCNFSPLCPEVQSHNFDQKSEPMISRKKPEVIEYALYGIICLLIFGLLFLILG